MIFDCQVCNLIHKLHHAFHHRLKIRMGINVQLPLLSIECKRRNQSGQTVNMVAMKVRNEDMVNLPHFESKFSELNLGAFPAIQKEQLFVKPNHLRSREPRGGRQG